MQNSHPLEHCRHIAASIRYAQDYPTGHLPTEEQSIDHLKDHFFKNGLFIEETSTPALSAKLDAVCERLLVPRSVISAFVQASPEIQAQCISATGSECILHFSSALINLLDEDEFAFVAGHEIGHFIYEHGAMHCGGNDTSFETLRQQRAHEISVDRTGLIASGDLDTTIRALIKTVSGLENEHLRFDTTQFISQVSKLSNPDVGEHPASTHPSMIIRCRALIWFALSDSYKTYPQCNDSMLSDLDDRIAKDLKKYVDGPFHRMVDDANHDLSMWMAMAEIIKDGRFDKLEQNAFLEMFGADILKKMKNFISNLSDYEVETEVHSRVQECRAKLEGLIPSSFAESYSELQNTVARAFRRSK